MKNSIIIKAIVFGLVTVGFSGCKVFDLPTKTENKALPEGYGSSSSLDSSNTAKVNWQIYFGDPNLGALINEALEKNQELNIVMQEIEISKNEIRARKGEYLPFVNLGAAAGVEKVGEYTRNGAVEKNLEVKPGREFPEPLGDFMIGAYASWEVDVWKKLRNAKKSAVSRYLASVEGKNFLTTTLVAEIADAYYELLALDNLLQIVEQNIEIQNNVFQILKQQKEAAKVSQLAVNRFEAQVLNTRNLQFDIRQKIVETENRINFLAGRFPQPITRNSENFKQISLGKFSSGIPSQLLENRPDIRQAELELMAAKLDIQVAKANFYPSFRLQAGMGFQAFNPSFIFKPESILYSLAGDLMAPLINRNAIKAMYNSANATQIQSIYNYERSILNAYLDVANQLAKVDNYNKSFETKSQEVDLLVKSIGISSSLFNSARADYMEVLLTQREALEANVELIEIKLKQLNAKVNIYRALGGGWQ
jgi:NodT family efflux transporter outer membrane factor (OMF) lipoprotein